MVENFGGTLNLINTKITGNTQGGGYGGPGTLTVDDKTFIGDNPGDDDCQKGQYRMLTMSCADCRIF